jgi:hypothetical protein
LISQSASGAAAVPHDAWMAARREILDAFAAGAPLVLLTGPAGVGKSRLLVEIEHSLRTPDRAVLRLENGEYGDLGTPPPVILVDEAERLERVLLRSWAARGCGFTVLAGLPALAGTLADLPHRRVELGPVRDQDIPAYIAARLQELGLPPTRLDVGVAEALAEATRGVPRLLNLLLAGSLFVAQTEGSDCVRAEHVREAAALRNEMFEEAPPVTAAPTVLEPKPEPELEQRPAVPGPPAIVSESAAETTGEATAGPPPVPQPAPASVRVKRHGARWALLAAVLVAGGVLAWRAVQDRPRPPIPTETAPAIAMAPPPAPSAPPPLDAAPAPLPEARVPSAPPLASPSASPPGPPSAPPPGPTAGLPSGAMVRVILTYPRGTAGAARAADVAAALERAGLAVGVPFPATQAAAGPRLSYFFHEDREAALQARVNAGPAMEQAVPRLERPEGATPRPGAIELTLPDAAGRADAPARAEETADAPAPAPAVLVAPADGAVLPAEAAQRGINLSWQQAAARPGCCFVEVVRLDGGGPLRAVFAAYAAGPGQQLVQLNRPGRYAWRVLTVSRAAQRYSLSPWRHFVLGEAQP